MVIIQTMWWWVQDFPYDLFRDKLTDPSVQSDQISNWQHVYYGWSMDVVCLLSNFFVTWMNHLYTVNLFSHLRIYSSQGSCGF